MDMGKIVSLTIVHYGADYISYALRSVAPFVDEIYVMLASQPSHGTPTNLVCPDSPEQMRETILNSGPSVLNKLRLVEGRWDNEGQHRDEIYNYTKHGDLIVVVDADEVWDAKNLQSGIALMQSMPEKKWYKVRMTNFWRSFNWACTDPMMQDRIVRVGAPSEEIIYSPFSALPEYPDIWHFGYARKPKDIEYKIQIHGHFDEWRGDWYQDKFLDWKPGIVDVHPTCVGFWTPQPFNKELLPEDLKSHPYYSLDRIE